MSGKFLVLFIVIYSQSMNIKYILYSNYSKLCVLVNALLLVEQRCIYLYQEIQIPFVLLPKILHCFLMYIYLEEPLSAAEG